MRTETTKLLEENIDKMLLAINHTRSSLTHLLRVLEIKTKIKKGDIIQLKSFCKAKETMNKIKRQSSEWEKIIASETTDKGFILKVYKQPIQFDIRKINSPIRQRADDLNRPISKEDIHCGMSSSKEGQYTQEKMFNIVNYLRNANQNYSKVSVHTSHNGHHQKMYKQYMLERMWKKGNSLALLVGM